MNERLVSMTKFKTRAVAVFALAAAGLLPAAAQAQPYRLASARPAPLYPYELQPGQPYAVEVAPGTYVIHRPSAARDYPYVRCVNGCEETVRRPPRHATRPPREPRRFDRAPRGNDPALIDELRTRNTKNVKKKTPKVTREVIHTTKVVRDPPVVIEHRRVVEDPPRVIERHHYVDDAPRQDDPRKDDPRKGEKRVIHAEAEVTILGPDRMSIRLFRKGDAPPIGKR
jgi:hypothetical protein